MIRQVQYVYLFLAAAIQNEFIQVGETSRVGRGQ